MSINVLSRFHDYLKPMKCLLLPLIWNIFSTFFKIPAKCNKSFIVKIPEFTYQFGKTNKKDRKRMRNKRLDCHTQTDRRSMEFHKGKLYSTFSECHHS